MGFYMGSNTANWRASGKRFRKEEFEKLDTIVSFATDMGVTSMYSDYVLPVSEHYERQDMMFEPRTPYIQAIDAAVAPSGESADDFQVFYRLSKVISVRARARRIGPIDDNFMGMPVKRDFTQFHTLFTMNGRFNNMKDVLNHQLALNPGVPTNDFDELAKKGFLRVNGSDGVMYSKESVYRDTLVRSVNEKKPYHTLTGRQQYYIDHDWFPGRRGLAGLQGAAKHRWLSAATDPGPCTARYPQHVARRSFAGQPAAW